MNREGQNASGPLAGVRILDLTRLLPGPMCTLYLADLGADVVKVEDTGAGDYARDLDAQPGTVSPFYRMVNRNKRSLAIDLKQPRGRDAFLALVHGADALVEGFRPGVMASLGLAFETLHRMRPQLVYASLSGYGQTGPRAARAGHDINYLGYAGVLDQTGTQGDPPALSNLQVADLLGGAATTAVGILAALIGAMRSGRGRYVDVSMTDSALAHNIFALHALEARGHTEERGMDLLTGGVPCYGVYQTQDGRWLAVGALEEKFWRLLCVTLGRDDLVPGRLARGEDGERVRNELATIFRSAPLATWLHRFADVDACVTPVATLREALADPQFAARDMIVNRPDGSHQYAPPLRMSDHLFEVTRDAPRQGEHSVEILAEAGLPRATIERLIADRVVRVS